MSIKGLFLLLFLLLLNLNLHSEDYDFIEYELSTNSNIVEVEFFNKFSGIMVTESAEIFYTTNGGKDWTLSDFKIDFTPKALAYSVSGEAVIIGSKSTIIKSYDYGENWLIMQYDKNSEVILNTIISKTPFEYFITQEGTRNIYYSVDGLQSISLTSLNGESGQYKTYPNLLSRSDEQIYCAGNRAFERTNNGTDYWNEG
ncbi:MAG: YCF48-related protein, partial [Candidatus Kapaibacterium sp.]